MKTKQEIIDFLESKVGTKVVCVGNPSLNGECVTLIKSLMEFLGVPDPYKARGNAKDCIANYLKEGIAKPGMGFISVFSNKDMAKGVGHIWCNAGEGNGTFYESNGAKPLLVTKGKTYTYDNVCNFDSYIKVDAPSSIYRDYDLSNQDSMKICVDDHIKIVEGQLVDKSQYEAVKGQLVEVQKQNESLSNQLGSIRGELNSAIAKIDSQNKVIQSYVSEDAVQLGTIKTAQSDRDMLKNVIINALDDISLLTKVPRGSDSPLNEVTKQIEALESLDQTIGSMQDKIKTLEAENKKLNTHKLPIDQLTNKELLYTLLSRFIKRS